MINERGIWHWQRTQVSYFCPISWITRKTGNSDNKKILRSSLGFSNSSSFSWCMVVTSSKPTRKINSHVSRFFPVQSKFKYILKITPKVRYRQRGYSASNEGWLTHQPWGQAVSKTASSSTTGISIGQTSSARRGVLFDSFILPAAAREDDAQLGDLR